MGGPYDHRPRNEKGVTTGEYVIFTPLVFVVCGVLLFWEFHLNDWAAASRVVNPYFGPGRATLIEAGAKRTDLIVDEGEWWRLISRKGFTYFGVCWSH